MIEINMNTKRLKLSIKGHALQTETDHHSAICTGVSAIAQGMAYTYSKISKAMREVQYRDDPGDLFLLAIPEDYAVAPAREIFKAYGNGLEMMAKCHPESVSMIWDGEKILPDKEDGKHE